MRYFLTILAFSITASINVMAQTTEITGYILTDLTDIVKIEGSNVNLRKAPSAKAPRLVTPVPPDGEYEPYGEWSDEAKGETEPYYGESFRPSVILGRNHDYGKYDDIPDDADLWVKLAYNVLGQYFPVWVKQSFCSIMPNGNIDAEHYYSNNYEKYQLSIRKTGQYEGLCLYQSFIEDSTDDPEGLYIGMLVDGQVVLPLRFRHQWGSWFNHTDDVKGIEICDGHINYNPSYEVDAQYEGGGFLTLDMDKFSDEDISKILAQCENASEFGQIILLRNTFDGGFFRVIVPTDESTFLGLPLEKVTKKFGNARKQDSTSSLEQRDGKVYESSEVAPSFPGGMGEMMSWLGRNMKYPDYAQYKNIQGRVFVRFVVKSDGSIDDVKVMKGVEQSLDNEAVRLVKAMPKWIPGTIGGTPVNVWCSIPVTFKLY